MSSAEPVFPSTEDHSIPDAIDFNIKYNASQPFFTFSDPATPTGVRVITHLEFGRAAHRIAHELRPNRSGEEGQVVAIIALSDSILYQAIVVGCIIAGLVPFPINPRNSEAAVIKLLKATPCRRLLTTRVTLHTLIDDLMLDPSTNHIQVDEVPSLGFAFPWLGDERAENPFEPYPAPLNRPSMDDICVYLHSSGSTGFPKPIPQTHRALMQWSSLPLVAEYRDYKPRLTIGCMALPAFHTFGFTSQMLAPVYGLVSVALYPPIATEPHSLPMPPLPETILEHLKLTRSNGLLLIPTTLQSLAFSNDAVNFMSTLEFVGYGGGPFTPKLGNLLVKSGVRLQTVYGSTEFGVPGHMPLAHYRGNDWQYVEFSDKSQQRWAPQGDGSFECQVLAWEKHTPMVLNLPDVKGYASSDVFIPHPTEKHLWKAVGRVDDIIVHSSGEKTIPAPIEVTITSSPIVHGALVFGRGQDETGVLIEPTANNMINVEDEAQVAALRNSIWPVIEEANKNCPAFSRIYKEMILFTSPDKPLPRAGKGTIMRKAALELYDKEIAGIYATVSSGIETADDIKPPESWVYEEIHAWIIAEASELLSGVEVLPDIDLFEQGFDSLSATFLRLRIIGALHHSASQDLHTVAQDLPQNLVYAHPMIPDLARFLASLSGHAEESHGGIIRNRTTLIEDIIRKYSVGFDDSSVTARTLRTTPAVVLLTGSTGNLGAEILAALLEDERINHIYVLNRISHGTPTMEERHLARFKEKGFNTHLLDSKKLSYLSGDATQPNLGLDVDQYNQLSESIDVVIHNAWRLDFNLTLRAFEPLICGSRNLIDLVRNGRNAAHARFIFTSSVACAQSWPFSSGNYPEEVVLDSSLAIGGGYGEGKYATERILANSGLHATSIRIGQISGGKPKGAWATTDWVPMVIKSSITIGRLPDLKGIVSWIPMDAAAAAIVDVALGTEMLPQALNLVHPRPVDAKEITKSIQDAIADSIGPVLDIVPFSEWLAVIEDLAKDPTTQTLKDIPAIKILDFVRGLSSTDEDTSSNQEIGGLRSFSTSKMLQLSPGVMGDLRKIGKEDVSLWVTYWKELEFL